MAIVNKMFSAKELKDRHCRTIRAKGENHMKAVRNFFIILICIVAVYFVGDKLELWPAGVREAVDQAFDNTQAALKKEDKPAGQVAAASAEEDEEESVSLKPLDADDEPEEIEEVSDEEVIEAWNDIYSTLKEMGVEGDVQGFMELANSTEEEAKYWTQALKDISYNNYDSQNTYVVWSNKKYYFVETIEYLVTGVHPNTHCTSFNFNTTLVKEDGEWRILNTNDMTEEELTEMDEIFAESIYGSGFVNAFRAGRNWMKFGNYMFTHPEMVFNGHLDTQVISAWQNEDGSMDILFCSTNGTNNTISYKSVDITLTDDSLGTICDVSPTEYWGSITPGRSKVFTVHVDPSNVLTGTAAWGNVYSHVHTSY